VIRRAAALPTLLALGCVVWIREPAAYREELIELVDTREKPVHACYESLLERRQAQIEAEEREAQGPYADIGPAVSSRLGALQGDVVVDFTVKPDSGAIVTALVPAKTTAPDDVVQCVLGSIQGMTLEPPDKREGRVALTFALQTGKHRSPAQ
jgi:hypothetical protein